MPYLYLLPAVLLVGVLLLYPTVATLIISFTRWDGISPPRFVALENYRNFLVDPVFVHSMLNTLIWVVGTLLLPVLGGLILAASLNRLPGNLVYKWLFYLPYALSFTTTGVAWSYLLNPLEVGGTINAILSEVGLGKWIRMWLYEPPLNTYAMLGAYTWQTIGTNMVLFLVGLQNIPKEPVEAAQIDGASGWQTFRYVTWPLLRPIATVVILMGLVNSFKVFDIIWVMTQGGPYRSSETLAVSMYREAFVMFRLGYGAAIAILLSVFVLALSAIYLRQTFQKVD